MILTTKTVAEASMVSLLLSLLGKATRPLAARAAFALGLFIAQTVGKEEIVAYLHQHYGHHHKHHGRPA